METISLVITVVGAVVGATWALRGSLSKIEAAIAGHVLEDKQIHAAHEARILKLEKRRSR